MPTCLFTGVELPPNTKIEHTIPRVLGGRVRSREVTSDAFNNQSSQVTDIWLHEPYASIFNHLAPLMAREHRQPPIQVEIPGGNGRLLLINGELTLRGLRIDARDEEGRPSAVSSEDVEAVRRFAAQQGWDVDSLNLEHESVTSDFIAYASRLVLSLDVELAVLKTCLATWDVALAGDPDRFTRAPCLAPILEMIRQGVMDRRAPEVLFTRYVHGLAYDRLDEIRQVRQRFGEPSPFEHLLVASGNAATRTLDLAFVVADTDPYGFRVPWDGPDTGTLVLANGVLRGTEVEGVHRAATPFSLGPRTQYCSFPTAVSTEEEIAPIARTITEHRHAAYRRAVDLVERKARDYVQGGIHTRSRFVASGLVADGLRDRLHRLFWDRIDGDEQARALLDRVIDEQVQHLPAEIRTQQISRNDMAAGHVSWDEWFGTNTRILDAVAVELGQPGAVFTRDMDIGLEPVDGRDVGIPGGRRR